MDLNEWNQMTVISSGLTIQPAHNENNSSLLQSNNESSTLVNYLSNDGHFVASAAAVTLIHPSQETIQRHVQQNLWHANDNTNHLHNREDPFHDTTDLKSDDDSEPDCPELINEISNYSESAADVEANFESRAERRKRKLSELRAEGFDPSKLEDSPDDVRKRFEKGCECQEVNCFKKMNPEFVYKHRLNIAELTKSEHDMYLMGVTMACLQNPNETSRHKKRKRVRTQYVFQGKRVCLDAFVYLENCTQYQMKRIRKHVMTHGVTPRVHGNHGRKPHNTLPLDIYQHATAFLQTYVQKYVSCDQMKAKGKKNPIYLPPEITKKNVYGAYKEFCEHFEPDLKIMGYSTFRHFMKEQFPDVRFHNKDVRPLELKFDCDFSSDKESLNEASLDGTENNSVPVIVTKNLLPVKTSPDEKSSAQSTNSESTLETTKFVVSMPYFFCQ